MQRRIGHPAYPAQRMILRYPFLRRNVTEHATLLLIVSAHVLLDAATPSPVTASATFSAACLDPFFPNSCLPRRRRHRYCSNLAIISHDMFEQAFKNIDDVLRKEAGCTTQLYYTEQTSWLLFLKYLDALEQDKADQAALDRTKY